MANGRVLRQLIRSGTEGDLEAFRGAAIQAIEEERQKQHHVLADELEAILDNRKGRQPAPVLRRMTAGVPVDGERGIPLLSIREPNSRLEDMVLSRQNLSLLKAILQEHNRADLLKAHGLRPCDRLLLYGPPGCGKTLTAQVIAGELGRPLAVVRIDSIVSSFLGETAANLRKIFDFANDSSLVLLFDEFDALGKEREDTLEHGELRRVVNAVLQMMEDYRGKSVLVAATNHEQMLDSAVWRRFDEILHLKPPTPTQVCQLLSVKFRGVRREFEIKDLACQDLFKGATHADVERIVLRAIKLMVLEGGDALLRLDHLEAALRRENARKARPARK